MCSIFNHPYSVTFGLYAITCDGSSAGPKQDYEKVITISNIIGWIPIIGTIVGVFRLYIGIIRYKHQNSSNPNDAEMDTCKGLMARGIGEIFCLGLLLFLIDIIFTIGRCCSVAFI